MESIIFFTVIIAAGFVVAGLILYLPYRYNREHDRGYEWAAAKHKEYVMMFGPNFDDVITNLKKMITYGHEKDPFTIGIRKFIREQEDI